MRCPPPPPPPPPPPLAPQPQRASPSLLRRLFGNVAPRSDLPCPSTPPSPPRFGRPVADPVDFVPETPPSLQEGRTPISYAEAVRGRRKVEDRSQQSPLFAELNGRRRRHNHPSPEPGWTYVEGRKRKMHLTAACGRRDGAYPWRRAAPGVPTPSSRRLPSTALLAFKKRTYGRCFNCLALDHRAAHCRDPVKCFHCRRYGHKEARCPDRRPPHLRHAPGEPPARQTSATIPFHYDSSRPRANRRRQVGRSDGHRAVMLGRPGHRDIQRGKLQDTRCADCPSQRDNRNRDDTQRHSRYAHDKHLRPGLEQRRRNDHATDTGNDPLDQHGQHTRHAQSTSCARKESVWNVRQHGRRHHEEHRGARIDHHDVQYHDRRQAKPLGRHGGRPMHRVDRDDWSMGKRTTDGSWRHANCDKHQARRDYSNKHPNKRWVPRCCDDHDGNDGHKRGGDRSVPCLLHAKGVEDQLVYKERERSPHRRVWDNDHSNGHRGVLSPSCNDWEDDARRTDGKDFNGYDARRTDHATHLARNSCKNDISWPGRHYDGDNNGDNFGCKDRERHIHPTRRERTRSPRRRDSEFRGGSVSRQEDYNMHTPRHFYSQGTPQGVPTSASMTASPSPLMDATDLKAQTTTRLQVLFNAQAMGFKHSGVTLSGKQCASWLADAENIPVARVFDRLRSAMHPTIEDVERALDTLELAADTTVLATAPPETTTPMECDPTPMECDPPVPLHDSSTLHTREGAADVGLVGIAQANEGETAGQDAVPATQPPGVDALFCTPEPAVINQLPTRRP
ncbi:unnamed protein product [Urochloa humidicola]